jgi:imidazolonepropionase-like amidohydrolase
MNKLLPAFIAWGLMAALASCHGARSKEAPPPAPAPAPPPPKRTALVGGTIYRSPRSIPLPNGVVLIEGEHVVDVGQRGRLAIPPDATVIDVSGSTVMAGFWNSHVHFTDSVWADAAHQPAQALDDAMRQRFTQYGFVHVYDTGSDLENTLALRRRVANGDVAGPEILLASGMLVPPHGHPRYVPDSIELPEPTNPDEARALVDDVLDRGADAIKIFTVSITEKEPFPVMPLEVVQAVVEETHKQGKLVFAHPTNRDGVTAAVTGGVDILAHTAPIAGRLPDSLYRLMVKQHMALIPTLKLWEYEMARDGKDSVATRRFVKRGVTQLSRYFRFGGRILFGTDAGYMLDYDPTREYELMADAGLPFPSILTTLTVSPAAEFGMYEKTGQIAAGYDADIVVVDGDPAKEISALAHVRLAMRRGEVIYGEVP